MTLDVGTLVVSKYGRDKDNYFLVVKKEGEYVYLCDGNIRKIENPKKKKIKHLETTEMLVQNISECKLTNKFIQKQISQLVSKEEAR